MSTFEEQLLSCTVVSVCRHLSCRIADGLALLWMRLRGIMYHHKFTDLVSKLQSRGWALEADDKDLQNLGDTCACTSQHLKVSSKCIGSYWAKCCKRIAIQHLDILRAVRIQSKLLALAKSKQIIGNLFYS